MRISQNIIDRRYSNAKRKKYQDTIEENGYIACESCGVNESQGPIDCSHIISREDCKRYDLLELIYDLMNLKWHCRSCHLHWENGTKVGFDTKKNLLLIKVWCDENKNKLTELFMKYYNRWEKHF